MQTERATKRLVVVGNGMAGMACVEQILKYSPEFQITVFGDETHVNYNRVMLSSVLAGERSAEEIVLHPREWYMRNEIDLRVGVRIVDVDPDAKTVTGNDGGVTPYDLLLLATGSSAFMPRIEGLDHHGLPPRRTPIEQRARVVDRAEDENAVAIQALDPRHERGAASGEQ